jgi:hypothetical protein|tara:strand:+ start:166 stop:399 length:234 start_codon:yes stop_codon:yes gene_type:complete
MVKKIIVKKAKYIAVRMPLSAYNNYKKRKARMELVIGKITRKIVRIPLTKVFEVSSTAPINLPDDYVLKLSKRKKKK